MVQETRSTPTRLLRHSWAVAALSLSLALTATAQASYQAEQDRTQSDDIAYQRYFTRDAFGRRITFYITKNADSSSRLPLVVSILGSGADSNFIRRDGRILDGHRVLRTVFSGRAYVLIVEKPGVSFCEHPKRMGTSDGAS